MYKKPRALPVVFCAALVLQIIGFRGDKPGELWYDKRNYDKEVTLMSNFPGTERPILRWAGKLGTFLGLSVMWLVCCLPLVTVFPACVALYDSVVNCVHGDEPSPFRRFFVILKDEVFRGILLSLLWIALITVFIMGFQIVNTVAKENSAFAVYSMVYAGTMLIPLSMLVWMIPLQAKFQYKFFELHRVAMSFVILRLPTTLGAIGILLLSALMVIVIWPLLLLLPAITVTLQSSMMEKILKKYEEE